MNRQQAGHILDAYVKLECAGLEDEARQSLREVILDAMSNYNTGGYASTYPYTITVPSSNCPINTSVTCKGREQ